MVVSYASPTHGRPEHGVSLLPDPGASSHYLELSMFAVVFARGNTRPAEAGVLSSGYAGRDLTLVGKAPTAAEAAFVRQLAGDLVVHQDTLQIVTDPAWLWPWERSNPEAFASKMFLSAGGTLPPRSAP